MKNKGQEAAQILFLVRGRITMMHPSKTWGGKSAKSLWNTEGAKQHKTQSGILPEALKKGTIEESSGEVKKEVEN